MHLCVVSDLHTYINADYVVTTMGDYAVTQDSESAYKTIKHFRQHLFTNTPPNASTGVGGLPFVRACCYARIVLWCVFNDCFHSSHRSPVYLPIVP